MKNALGPLPTRTYDRAMNSEIERLDHQFEVIVTDVKGMVGALNDDQLNWNPGDGRWSVAQCIEHLNMTNRRWLPLFKQAIEQGRSRGWHSDGPFSYGYLARLFLRIVEPPYKLKVKTPREFMPGERIAGDKLTEEFVALHERVRDLLRAANGLDLSRIKVPSAFASWLKYPLGAGFWILSAHDRRHIWQARELMQTPEFPI